MGDLRDLSLTGAAARLRDGSVTARRLADRALAADRLGAYHHRDPERTGRQADAADAALAAGYDPGPLLGIPVSIKDLYGVPGYPTWAGTPAALPARFAEPGPVVRAVLSQLAVVTGKTHTVELAFGGIGTNPHHPTPINPWDAERHRVPGGSSAGAGVSLAEGSAMLALGTDTAGSVRIPASWTGNVGLKTTKGRWSTAGIVPLSTTLDTAGILARSVADLIVAFGAIDPGGPPDLPRVELADVVIGRRDRLLFDDCSPGVVEAVDAAVDELVAAGARVRSLELPELEPTKELFDMGGPVSVELHRFLTAELPDRIGSLDPNVQARVGDAASLPAHEYLRRRETMAELAASAAESLRGVDVLVSPTVASTPPTVDEVASPEGYAPRNLLSLRNTCIPSYLGLSAVTLPVGVDAAGMPVGMQLVARPFEEERLLAVARAFEDALGAPRERLGTPPR